MKLYQSVPHLLGHWTVLIIWTVLEVGQKDDLEEDHSQITPSQSLFLLVLNEALRFKQSQIFLGGLDQNVFVLLSSILHVTE